MTVLGLCIGLFQVWRLRWVCDDAYISFVYARNIWEGNGWVFQLGERVEGFSNPIWTLGMVLSFPIGIRVEDFAQGVGMVLYLFTLLQLQNPFLILSYSLFSLGALFGTGGLETSLYTFLLLVSYRSWKQGNWWKLLAFSGLLAITRPDGGLFSLGHLILIVIHLRSQTMETLMRDLAIRSNQIHLVIFVSTCALYLTKSIYYGDIFPNTYYAKASGGGYWMQGLDYLSVFVQEYPILSAFSMVGLVVSRSHYKYLVLFYFIYLVYVGGDFMFGRFIVPIIPVILVLVWEKIQENPILQTKVNWSQHRVFAYLVAGLFLLSPGLATGYFEKNKQDIYSRTGIVDERKVYYRLGKPDLIYDPEALRDLSVSFWGAQAHFIYYMKPARAIESSTGLTDSYLAKRKIEKRGRIGHEKKAPLDYLVQAGVHIVMGDVYPELHDSGRNLYYLWDGNRLLWKVISLPISEYNKLAQNPNFDTSELRQEFLK